MLQQPTLNALRQLNLYAMAEALDEQSRLPQIQDLSFEERLGLLLDRELCARDQRRLTYIATRATPENERKCEWVVAGRDRAKFW